MVVFTRRPAAARRAVGAVKGLQNGGIYKTVRLAELSWQAVRGLQSGGIYKYMLRVLRRRWAVKG